MHEPVLLSEVLAYLSPQRGEAYLDATAGYGGHAKEVLKRTQNYQGSVLVDRDQMAIDQLQLELAKSGVRIIKNDFYKAAELLASEGKQFDLILADLGVSSPHLNMASRGFSFLHSGNLDMRMDQQQELSAGTIVNEWSADHLEKIIREYGEEPKARIIVRSILANRPIKTTSELAKIIARTTGKWQVKHPATRTFQALRIAVNRELELLEIALPIWLRILKPKGRLAIISFHSLEDRIVKQFFAQESKNAYEATLKLLTKNPVVASKKEVVNNPRSRSAKLRVAVKINTTERTSDEN
jgi:16S rRNA (cytosine1402-N4)-methyltransferase